MPLVASQFVLTTAEILLGVLVEHSVIPGKKDAALEANLKEAIHESLVEAADIYPGFGEALEDQTFLTNKRVEREIRLLLHPTKNPDIKTISHEWTSHFGRSSRGNLQLFLQSFLLGARERIRDIEGLEEKLHRKEALEFIDGATERLIYIQADISHLKHEVAQLAPNGQLIQGPPKAQAVHQIPPSPADFTGRRAELQELLAVISNGGVTIHGTAGVGKTAIAIELASRLSDDFPDIHIFINLKGDRPGGGLSPEAAMRSIMGSLLGEARLPDDVNQLVSAYQSAFYGKRSILVFDNAESASQVKPLIPAGSNAVIVTSRQRFKLAGLQTSSLDKLERSDSRSLLLKIAPRISDNADRLAMRCGDIPLSLKLAGSNLAVRDDMRVEDFIKSMDSESDRLDILDSAVALADADLGIRATISTSWDALPPEHQSLLACASVFPESFESLGITAVWLGIQEMNRLSHAERLDALERTEISLRELYRFSLLMKVGHFKRYQVHDLVRLFGREMLDSLKFESFSRAHAMCYEHLLASREDEFRQGGSHLLGALAWFDSEYDNLRSGQAWAASNMRTDKEAAVVARDFPDSVGILEIRLDGQSLVQWLNDAIRAAQLLGDDHAEARHLTSRANIHKRLGSWEMALDEYRKALEIATRLSDANGEAVIYSNLASIHREIGQYDLAEVYREKLSAMGGHDLNEGDLRSYELLTEEGIAARHRGDLSKAVEIFEFQVGQALEHEDIPFAGAALINLGNTQSDMHDIARAMQSYERAMEIGQMVKDPKLIAGAAGNLGRTLHDIGQSTLAITAYETQLAICTETGDLSGKAKAMWNMAIAIKSQDLNAYCQTAEEAIKLFEQLHDPFVETAVREWSEACKEP